MGLGELATTAFATFLVALGPIETAAIFGGLTAGAHRPQRLRLAWRAVAVAGAVMFAFALFGVALLGALHITLDAFRIAGGVLLLMQAAQLIFGHAGGLSTLTPGEEREAMEAADIAVFPLAFPLIAGPAALTAVVLLMGDANGDPAGGAVVVAAMAACLGLTFLCMALTELIERVLKQTGANVVARLSGLILAALAVQFMVDGLRGARLFTG